MKLQPFCKNLTNKGKHSQILYVLFRWKFLWVFQRWWDNNDNAFTLSSSDLLKDLSAFKLENMAIRLLLTGASEGWSAPGTTSQGQSASRQSSPFSQLMLHGSFPGRNPVPTNEHRNSNDYYRALLYEMLWEKGSQLQLDWRGSWGGLLYHAISSWLLPGPSQARAGERPQRQWCGHRGGLGWSWGNWWFFATSLGVPKSFPKHRLKQGKRGWLLIFWRVYRLHRVGDSDTMKQGLSYLTCTECYGNFIAHMHSYRWYMVVSDGLICHSWYGYQMVSYIINGTGYARNVHSNLCCQEIYRFCFPLLLEFPFGVSSRHAEALKARPSEKVQRSQRWAVLKHMAIICVFSKGSPLGF